MIQAFLSDVDAFAFVAKRARDHGHGENAQLFGDFGNHGRGAGAGAAAHAGGDKQHIGTADGFGDGFAIFLSGRAADFGVGTGTQAAGEVHAQLDAFGCIAAAQGLRISIRADEFHALHGVVDHIVDGIAAAAADADYFDYRRACGRLYYVVNQFHKNAPLRPALRRI